MSAIAKGEATSEEALSSPLVYADLSRQFVQPFEESDSSVSTPPVLVAADENPEIEFNEQKSEDEQPENLCSNAFLHFYLSYQGFSECKLIMLFDRLTEISFSEIYL